MKRYTLIREDDSFSPEQSVHQVKEVDTFTKLSYETYMKNLVASPKAACANTLKLLRDVSVGPNNIFTILSNQFRTQFSFLTTYLGEILEKVKTAVMRIVDSISDKSETIFMWLSSVLFLSAMRKKKNRTAKKSILDSEYSINEIFFEKQTRTNCRMLQEALIDSETVRDNINLAYYKALEQTRSLLTWIETNYEISPKAVGVVCFMCCLVSLFLLI